VPERFLLGHAAEVAGHVDLRGIGGNHSNDDVGVLVEPKLDSASARPLNTL
jgi:hypothetical protein